MMTIESLSAGLELDALISERIFGKLWLLPSLAFVDHDGGWHCVDYRGSDNAPRINDILPHYSTDIAAAWEVVARLTPEFTLRRVSWAMRDRGDGITYMQENGYHNGWWAVATEEGGVYSFAETAPLAICRAALKAVAP